LLLCTSAKQVRRNPFDVSNAALHRDLAGFTDKKEHFIDGANWMKKHPDLAMVSDQPEDEK
jgi:hypothetical protein